MAVNVAHDEVPSSYPNDVDSRDVRDLLGGFVSKKADNDATISEDHSSILASCNEDEQRESTQESASKEVGRDLADIAASISEEIDHAYGDSIQNLIGRIGTPQLAFRTFQSVANTLFSWGSGGAQVGKLGTNLSALFSDNSVIL